MKRRILIVILVLLAAGAGAALYYSRTHGNGAPADMRLSGNIEVTEVQLSFRLPGWVTERPVDEGESITAGQLIARLDARELTQEVALRQAGVAAARAALAELEAGSRPEEIAQAEAAAQRAKAMLDELLAGSRPQEIEAAEAAVNRVRAELLLAQQDYARALETAGTGAISKSQRDAAKSAVDVAQAKLAEAEQKVRLVKEGPRQEEIAQARAALGESEQRRNLVKKGPRQETIAQARAKLDEAEQALAMVQTRLSYTTLNSPLAGVVLSKNVEQGEYVAAGTPIITLGNLKDVWLRVYIHGPDLGRVKLGQKAKVRTDSYPGKVYEGRVSFIASEAEFTPKSVQTSKERVKLVYRIKIDLDNGSMELKPGMPADADIVLE